jgi:AP-3 complex subunit beta
MSFKKCSTDLSPYVRKAVAISLGKCHRLDQTQDHILLEMIESMLNDKSTIVLGPLIASINEICPGTTSLIVDRLDLLHKHFRKICKLLPDSDEWSQIQIIQTMARYARMHFVLCSTMEELDSDFLLLIQSCRPLLHSRNPLVVLLISVFYYEIAIKDLRVLASQCLLRCLIRPKQEQHMILSAIKELIMIDKEVWLPHIKQFAVYSEDTQNSSLLKMEILELLTTTDNWKYSFQEFYVIHH